jgi:ABC-type proline/glycine betaine transport system permease subunit
MLMTSGQLASYDQIKEALLKTSWFKDDVVTHLTAGSISGVIATVICSPIDVIKTRLMNMKEGQYKGFSFLFF